MAKIGLTQGTVNLGDIDIPITSYGTTVALIPAISAAAIYHAGDAVGGLLTFANSARVAGSGGVIKSVLLVDDSGTDVALELWLFNATFVAMADHAAWAPAEADLEKLIGVIYSTDGAWAAAGTPSVNSIKAIGLRYDLTGTSMFGQLVTRGTPTFAAVDDVTVKVQLLQD